MANTVLLTGGTGLIGKKITNILTNEGYTVHILTRTDRPNTDNIKYFQWNINSQEIEEGALEGVNHIVHLVGASVAQRWTKTYRETILASRIDSANFLFKKLKENNITLDSFVSASASGFYPANTGKIMNEDDLPGTNFLAEVCKKWEAAAHQFAPLTKRLVIHRIGVVFATNGGALEKMLPPFQFNMAPYFGNGKQYYPWIHVDDVAQQIAYTVTNPISGTYNASAGNITQRQLNEKIAAVLGKKVIHLPAPIAALQVAMGDMHQIVTDSIQTSNHKIKATGFAYQFTDAGVALKNLLT